MKKLILICLITPVFCFAQYLEKGNKNYAVLQYNDAIQHYEKYLSKQENKKKSNADSEKSQKIYIQVLKNLADSYYSMQKYNKAEKFYKELYNIKKDNMEAPLFIRLISTLRHINNTREANELFNEYYAKSPKKIKVRDYQERKLDSLQTLYNKVVNLSMNSEKSDFGVAIYKNEAIFSSSREGSYLNLYSATRNQYTGQLDSPEKYGNTINSEFNDATFAFNKANDLVFFSRNHLTDKGKLEAENGKASHIMIMKGEMIDNQIKEIKPLSINNSSYNCSHPFVSANGTKLYFASDKPGGFGGTDIYVVDLYNDGSTGTPINLGPKVNTPGSEMYPSISGDTLFFSSDFFYGYGGLDVFYAVSEGNNKYSIPQNVGKPINSNGDDFAFIQLKDRTGYFSSNREGGKGSDDIYWFNMKEIVNDIDYSGLVLTKNNKKPIPNADIKVYDIYDEVVQELQSDSVGNYKMTLPTDAKFKVVFSKDDYSTETVDVITPKKPANSDSNDVFLTSFKALIEKDKNGIEKIKVNPIYFDYDKYNITSKAEEELEKVLFAMKEFPSIKIKIEAHTDARGSDSYNLKLSDERAKATRNYLISEGIDSTRVISAIGYGETKPLNNCTNGVHCTEEEYAINRRSDFIIVEK